MKSLQPNAAAVEVSMSKSGWNWTMRMGSILLTGGWLVSLPVGKAQSYDFNNGNDTGWTHLDLSAAGLPPATYTFPNDGLGGKAYRIQAPVPPIADAGPARAFSYPANDYSRFAMAVDAISWDTNVNQAFGLLVRATSIGLASTDGYVMNYNVADGDLQINAVLGENPGTIAETPLLMTPSAGPYRWVFSGYGENLLGQVFVLPDLDNPIGSVAAIDSQNASGKSGLFVFNRSDNVTEPDALADATFDNYAGSVPAAGSLRATVVLLTPAPRQQVAEALPVIQAAILDRETSVQTNSIQLWVDGTGVSTNNLSVVSEVIMPNNVTPFAGATVSHQPTNFFSSGNLHTVRLVYADEVGLRTNEWTFTAIAVALQSSPTLSPPEFQTESGAIVDTTARTITVAQSGGQRYYRLSAGNALTISGVTISGNNVILNYQ